MSDTVLCVSTCIIFTMFKLMVEIISPDKSYKKASPGVSTVAQWFKNPTAVVGELGVNRYKLLPLNGLAMRSCCVALGTISSHL